MESGKWDLKREIFRSGQRADEVLVKLEYVGICGSDLHYYETGAIGDYVVEPPFILLDMSREALLSR